MHRPKITVVGSINMDLSIGTSRIPLPGETVIGKRFSTFPGGKGANQAVACARLGADVTMIGCVGDDVYGENLINNLNNEGIRTDYVNVIKGQSSGIATITMDDNDNCIVVIPGANHSLTPEMIKNVEDVISQSDIVLVQLEIPMNAVEESVRIANQYNVPIILNPAPAVHLSQELIDLVTLLTPNEHELAITLGKSAQDIDFRTLLSNKFVMTYGSDGAYFVDEKGEIKHQHGFKVKVADTTGAGDTFNGALAVKLSQNHSLSEAVHFAVATSALSVTKIGAQAGMPTKEEVEAFLSAKKQ